MIPIRLRRLIFWGHLLIGVAVGLIILILAITGFLMSFETQVVGAIERRMVRSSASGSHAILPPEAMIKHIQATSIQGHPGSINYTRDPDDPVILLVDRGNQQLFHPTTGDHLGKGAARTRSFFRNVLSIHRWLTLSNPSPPTGNSSEAIRSKSWDWKEIGGSIQAAGTLALLILVVSGLILWVPRKLSRQALRAILIPRPRLKGRSRDWNFHHSIGFWATPSIIAIAITGLIMTYPWANKLLFQSFGETPPVKQGLTNQNKPSKPIVPISTRGLDQAAEVVRRQIPDWASINLELSTDDSKPILVTVTDEGRGRPDRRVKFTIDRTTGSILEREGFDRLSTATRLRQLTRWIHTGEIGGIMGQILAATTCVAIIFLIWTGYALAWRRMFKRSSSSKSV